MQQRAHQVFVEQQIREQQMTENSQYSTVGFH